MVLAALLSIFGDHGWMRPTAAATTAARETPFCTFATRSAQPFLRRSSCWHPASTGDHKAHRRRSVPPANRLLTLMTGSWTTQAIAVAAELELADLLAANPEATVAELAKLTDTDEDSLGRLLQYLTSIG